MATEQHNVNDIGGIKLPPPNEIAKAVLSAPIKGVVFTELKDLSKQKDIVVKECIDLLAPFYGSSPIKHRSKSNIEHIRKQEENMKDFGLGHTPFNNSDGRINYLYCGRCYRNKPHSSQFHMSVIAAIRCGHETVDGRVGEYIATVELLALYPHCNQCNEDHNQRRNHCMRHSGHHINDIPLDSIIGDTYAPILLKMDTTKPGDEGEHFGKRINNKTNEGVEEWDFDKRYHLILDKVTQETLEFFNIEGTIDDWQKKHNQAMTRFFFWIVNYYNIPQEAITIPTIFEYGTRGTKKAQLVVGVPPFGNLTSAGVHLTLRHPAILSGGHIGSNGGCSNDGNMLHQLFHRDFADVEIDGTYYSVTNNPLLHDCHMPGSIIAPLVDTFGIVVPEDNSDSLGGVAILNIDKGKHVAFDGSFIHAGESYDPSQVSDRRSIWRPRLHVYLYSSHHPSDLDVLDVPLATVVSKQPTFLSRLKTEMIEGGLDMLFNNVHAAIKSCLSNCGENQLVIKLIKHHLNLCNEMIQDFERKKKRNRRT